jgi:hypothetical protein
MVTQKTNTTIHSEGREIIANIIEKCEEERAQMQFLLPLSKATKRAAMYAGVSCSAIKKIRQENKARKETHLGNSQRSSGKKRRIIERNVVYVDDFDKCVIRNIIQDFYVQEKRVPTIPKLLPVIKEKNTLSLGPEVFRQSCKKNGI